MIIYDYLRAFGGAEQTLPALAGAIDCREILVAGIDHRRFSLEACLPELKVSSLGLRPSSPALLAAKSTWLFSRQITDLHNTNKILVAGAYTASAISNFTRDQRSLYFCFAPPRFAYDHYGYYFDELAAWKRPAFQLLVKYVRWHYEKGVRSADRVVTISKTVQDRLKNYLGVDSVVVSPPCRTKCFFWHQPEDYYLSTARLERYKNVDLIVKAFLSMPDKNLVITSSGSDEKRLKALAAGAANIRFTGWLNDTQKAKLISRCIATIYVPLDEDYGLSPIESMAAGKPVIGVRSGGLCETVIDGETGVLIDTQNFNLDGLVDTIKEVSKDRAIAMTEACRTQAARVSGAKFQQILATHWHQLDSQGPQNR